jgi:hypothetical protein
MKAQLTLTVNEGKRLIAKAIAQLPEVQRALREGIVLLKGGTTVSAVAEEIAGIKLRISGRVTPQGTLSAAKVVPGHHSLALEKGTPRGVDGELANVAERMGPGDVFICGANIIDAHGNAAIMVGSPFGGEPGRFLATLQAEGVISIVAAGLEKLSPTPIEAALAAAGRRDISWAMGMAVGLVPVPGRLITEQTALTILAPVKVTVIGRGGILGAEGATTLIVEGEPEEVEKICQLLLSLKGAGISGIAESLSACRQGGPNCSQHLGCIYKASKRGDVS